MTKTMYHITSLSHPASVKSPASTLKDNSKGGAGNVGACSLVLFMFWGKKERETGGKEGREGETKRNLGGWGHLGGSVGEVSDFRS